MADEEGITPGVTGAGHLVQQMGDRIRMIQNGYVRTYGLTMVIGAVLIGLALLLGRLV
jgi:NADH-quinone oxidoreductase subunit L